MRVGFAAATWLVFVMGCGSNMPGTDEAQPQGISRTTALSASTTTSVTSLATTTLRPPALTTCRGSQWTMSVPSGWFANVQAAGSKFRSCWLIAPAKVAQQFGIADGVMRIPESTDAHTEWLGPYIVVSLTQMSVQELLSEFVRQSGSDATVEITDSDVRIVGVAPAISVRRVVMIGDRKDLRVRVRYTSAESIGYGQKGQINEELLVATPNGGTVTASINSGSLLGDPSAGISIDDAAAALDVIAGSLQLV